MEYGGKGGLFIRIFVESDEFDNPFIRLLIESFLSSDSFELLEAFCLL